MGGWFSGSALLPTNYRRTAAARGSPKLSGKGGGGGGGAILNLERWLVGEITRRAGTTDR